MANQTQLQVLINVGLSQAWVVFSSKVHMDWSKLLPVIQMHLGSSDKKPQLAYTMAKAFFCRIVCVDDH